MGVDNSLPGLPTWGQLAAIILVLYLFVSATVALGLAATLMLILTWVREKAEHIKRLRPAIDQVNAALSAGKVEEPLPPELAEHQLLRAVSQIPKVTAKLPVTVSAAERKVEQGSDRVVQAVIEFRARTEMVKGMAKAFFLPGLTRSRAGTLAQPMPAREPEPVVAQNEGTLEPPPYEEMVIFQRTR